MPEHHSCRWSPSGSHDDLAEALGGPERGVAPCPSPHLSSAVGIRLATPPVLGPFTMTIRSRRRLHATKYPQAEPRSGTPPDRASGPRPPSRKTRPVSRLARGGQPGHLLGRQSRVVRRPLDLHASASQEAAPGPRSGATTKCILAMSDQAISIL